MMKNNPEFLARALEAQSRIEEISVAALHEILKTSEHFFLIDVREENEWQRGHIPKAIHLSMDIIEDHIERIVTDKSAQVILYCGKGLRSAVVADNLQKFGYGCVRSLQGGFSGWFRENFPIEF